MKAIVWGGAGEHGRSCYYIENEGMSILLDCGGKKEKGGIYPLLDERKVKELDAVFLSHAHEDHSMALPLLYKLGFKGEVWTSKETAAQLPAYFEAWIKYVRTNGGSLPYKESDIERIKFRYFEDSSTSLEWFEVKQGIRARWGASGHMVGAVWLQLELNGKKVFFSGDYCAEPFLLHRDLPYSGIDSDDEENKVDLAIVDAAYGLDSNTQKELVHLLMKKISEVLDRGGKVLLPVPLFGRGQDLTVLIGEYFQDVPIAVEENLLKGLENYKDWSKWLCKGAIMRINDLLNRNRFIPLRNEHDRLKVLQNQRPLIIFTTEGTLQSGKAKWYYDQLNHNALNAILFTGYVNNNDKEKSNHDLAKSEVVNYRFKVHQGVSDVSTMLSHIKSEKTLLVHAKKEDTDLLCDELKVSGYKNINSLTPGECIEI